ncbi:MAG: amylo-alpha-1,6-glucosidase [Thermoflexales bacterium]|nr:amylo-alpha-1,6-glucosidase [Thermoflexales bacterium]
MASCPADEGGDMIDFGSEICGTLKVARTREWLETNGLGGFASSTVIGLNTRRYHGLLVAAVTPPTERMVLLARMEETLALRDADGNERRIELGVGEYERDHPAVLSGVQTRFRLDPFPIFTYEVEGWTIEKAVWMVHGHNTTCIQYTATRQSPLPADTRAELRIRPLVAARDFHSLKRENGELNPNAEVGLQQVTLRPYPDAPALRLSHDADLVDPTAYWYRGAWLETERERGYDHIEDNHSPCELRYQLGAGTDTLSLIASTEIVPIRAIEELRRGEIARREGVAAQAPFSDPLVSALTRAADAFVVARGAHKSLIAGYPWFSDWGRDTMIALPGLTLATGRFDVARDILTEFSRHLSQGMIPNRFPDRGQTPEYNTVDATLWMIEAGRALVEYTGDATFFRDVLYAPFCEVIDWHERGTRYGIRLDEDGLLRAGEPGVQLTWMDAKYRDWVVTPREGKAVEIQALWFNALQTLRGFASRFGDPARSAHFAALAERTSAAFNARFWNAANGCLYDVVDGPEGREDPSVRPNQIFAVSLPHSMLAPARAKAVVDVVVRELLTPVGLRSLSPNDPRFIGRYGGDLETRDSAYHQGTVWAWLMGPLASAYVRVHDRDRASRAQVRRWLNGFLPHLEQAGVGSVSEVFDGLAPYQPGGCIAQAWSVAELLRASVEDV